jgi:hypothetical protein
MPHATLAEAIMFLWLCGRVDIDPTLIAGPSKGNQPNRVGSQNRLGAFVKKCPIDTCRGGEGS